MAAFNDYLFVIPRGLTLSMITATKEGVILPHPKGL